MKKQVGFGAEKGGEVKSMRNYSERAFRMRFLKPPGGPALQRTARPSRADTALGRVRPADKQGAAS